MAITIVVQNDDGTAVGANSYVDEEYVADYAEMQGSSVWCDNVSKQKVALIQATMWIDRKYRGRYPGQLRSKEQSTYWPRSNECWTECYRSFPAGLPKELKDATAEAALQYIRDGQLTYGSVEQNNVRSESVSVGGVVTESRSYFGRGTTQLYPLIDSIMQPILTQQGIGMIQVVR